MRENLGPREEQRLLFFEICEELLLLASEVIEDFFPEIVCFLMRPVNRIIQDSLCLLEVLAEFFASEPDRVIRAVPQLVDALPGASVQVCNRFLDRPLCLVDESLANH